jgi:hypothetical protein
VDLARSEAVKAELAHLLEGRSSRELDSDEREALWRESVRSYNARRREEMRAAWWEVPPRASRAPQSRPRGPDSSPRGRGREVDGRSTGRGSMKITDKMSENLNNYRVRLEETQEPSWRPFAYSCAGESPSGASEAAE